MPNKWQCLHQFQQYRISNVISNVQAKPTVIKLTNHSTVKKKTVMFSKENTPSIIVIDHSIKEFEPYDLANVNSKVTKEGEVKDKTGLKLTEFAVTDNPEKLIQLTLIIPRSD